jgi:hypothetical protein
MLRVGTRAVAVQTGAPPLYPARLVRFRDSQQSSANTDAPIFNNPKRACDGLLGEEIQHERTLLATTHIDDSFVWLATEGLLNDGMSLVPIGGKQRRQ